MLRSATSSLTRIFVVIDALDECERTTRDILFRELRRLEPFVSLFLTSRYIFYEHHIAHSSQCLQVQANELDIKQYVDVRLKESETMQSYLQKDPHLRVRIIDGVVNKAKGM